MVYGLHHDPEDYFRLDCHGTTPFSRAAAREVCEIIANRGRQLIGMEGGRYDNGSFQPDLSCSWTRNMKAETREEAETINLSCILSIDEDPPEINAYMIRSVLYRQS